MHSSVSLYDKHQHSLNSLKRQQKFTLKYGLPQLVVNTHIPGELSEKPYSDTVYQIAIHAVKEYLTESESLIIDQEVVQDSTGLEATLVIKGTTASQLKRAMAYIENNHPLGRLINIDVINPQGRSVSRKGTQMEPRKCLLCESAASYCAINHRHSLKEIEKKIIEMVAEYLPNKIAV